MPLEGLSFVKTSATFGIINVTLIIICSILGTSNSLFVRSRSLKKIYRVEHFRANVQRQRERHQTKGLMSRTMAVHVRYKSFYLRYKSFVAVLVK